jgi:hypothetical protein
MMGEVYVQDGENRVALGEAANSLLLEYPAAPEGLTRETVLFSDDKLPVGATFEQGGDKYVVSFSKFKASRGGRFPAKITIQGGDRSLEINYTNLEINPVLGDQAFNVSGS